MKSTRVVIRPSLWETVVMKPPAPKFVSKKPATWKCAACSETFSISSYKGQGEEKIVAPEADYEKHFMERHMQSRRNGT